MFKRLAVALTAFLVFFGSVVYVEAKTTFSKDDEWLIYMYICGSNLEESDHQFTKNLDEIQQVRLPKNVKVLIDIGGARLWHHPTLKEGGNGIYLYTRNRLEKLENLDKNMGDPKTLQSFLEYGEKNFNPDHRILVFWNHGGLHGICYDEKYKTPGLDENGNVVIKPNGEIEYYNPYLTYDDLTEVFSKVYPNSTEELPFELINFPLCVSASYELANSIADFSHYMVGSEPSTYGGYFKDWISALAKDPSMNGKQIGKIICDSTMEQYSYWNKTLPGYSKDFQKSMNFSLIDLTKMPQLREANEEFFDRALELSSDASNGFNGA